MGGKLSKKKSCDLPNPDVPVEIQEPENKAIKCEAENMPQDVKCNEANMSKDCSKEVTAYQEKAPEASTDETQSVKHQDLAQEDVEESNQLLLEAGSGKTKAAIESETNKIVQYYEEPILKTVDLSDQGTGIDAEPLPEKSSSQLEDSNKSDLLKCESEQSANVLKIAKAAELKTAIVDLDANPHTDSQTVMLNVNGNVDEIACEHIVSVSSDMGSEQGEQGNAHCETNGEDSNDLSSVEKCGVETETTFESLQQKEGPNQDTQCPTQKINQDIELKNSDEPENITVPPELEIKGEQTDSMIAEKMESMIEKMESMIESASFVLQQMSMKEQNSSAVQVEQDANMVMKQEADHPTAAERDSNLMKAEQQVTVESVGSPGPTEVADQTCWTPAKENTTQGENLASLEQSDHVRQTNFLTQVEQMEQVPCMEECEAESNRDIVPGTE